MKTTYLKMRMCLIILCCALLSACTSTLKIHTDFLPAGSLRLAQVVTIIKRAELITSKSKPTYDAIIASGIKDSDIVDGSVVIARVFCCGGVSAKADATVLFVPKGLSVSLLDVVEVRSGRSPKGGDTGLLNTVTRVIQRNEEKDAHCWWDPKDDRLWLRVLYCDWMPKEGWIKKTGFYQGWYKPAVSSP